MFVQRKRTWIATVLFGGVALPHVWRRVLTVTAISVAVTVLYLRVPAVHYSITTTPFTLIGVPLGIFLGFRNNTAYDRFWEGRKLWGGLVNTARSLTRQILTLIEPQPEAEEQSPEVVHAYEVAVVHTLIAYIHALRIHLRGESFDALVTDGLVAEGELARLKKEPNVPIAILFKLGEQIRDARRKQWIHAYHVPVIEQSLVSLTDLQGACERIKSTPTPYSYSVLMHRIVAVYCGLLPFGLAESIGWVTPVVVLFISYALFGLDAVGDEVEEPFGLDPNDLPLTSISRSIEQNARARIGEPVPPATKAKRGVLS
ncbi:MAG: bestrophin family protein [Labilithrix sp.]|nr:bestrophin family protein [Labilithrix sp.]